MRSAMFVSLAESKNDPGFIKKGERKNLVTQIYPESEEEAKQIRWQHKGHFQGKTPVQLMKDTESAIFNETAEQTRHKHDRGTEIYLVLEGKMTIEVEHREYHLEPGDMMVVNPGAFHEIKRAGKFLCRVITVNCLGKNDKIEKSFDNRL